jgi:hypothetical protein
LPAIGHFVPFEAPEAFVEAIRTVLSRLKLQLVKNALAKAIDEA